MNISFYIRNKTTKTTPVYCSVKMDCRERIILKVPNSNIDSKQWENGWIKTGRGYQNNLHIETYLNTFKLQIETFAREYFIQNKVNPTKEEIDSYISSEKSIEDYLPKQKVIELIPLLEQIVLDRSKGFELNDGKKFSDGTIRNHRATVVSLGNYAKHVKRKLTNRSVIAEDYMVGYRLYLTEQCNMQLNSVSNRLKTAKSLIEKLKRKGLIEFNPFERYNIAIKWERANGIALEDDEIKELINLDLEHDSKLERARDLFVVLIFTGLRVSDLKSLRNFHVVGNMFTIHNQKTFGISHIPVFPPLRAVLDKYDNRIPPLLSEQKFRETLKEVGKMMPTLQQEVEVQYTKGGIVIREMIKRHELLCLHVGRRTLATFLARNNIPYHEIMIITGHKSVRDFENYIRVDKKSTLQKLVERTQNNFIFNF